MRTLAAEPGFVGRGGGAGGGGATTPYAWTAAAGDVAAAGWREMAEKLNAEVRDKEAPPRAVRVAVLNHLGAQGWELVSESGTTPNAVFTFKRRVP